MIFKYCSFGPTWFDLRFIVITVIFRLAVIILDINDICFSNFCSTVENYLINDCFAARLLVSDRKTFLLLA